MQDSKKPVNGKLSSEMAKKYTLAADAGKSTLCNGKAFEWENATEEQLEWCIKYKHPQLKKIEAAPSKPSKAKDEE